MALELIAAVIFAATLGLLAWVLRRWYPGLPKWFVPFVAGAGLIGFTVWSEYDWYSRVSAELPPEVPVVWSEAVAQPLRPWTYAFPITTRFVAMDTRALAAHPSSADLIMARLYNFARWQGVKDTLMIFDCAAARRVLLTEEVAVSEAGELSGADWQAAPEGDRMQAVACGKG